MRLGFVILTDYAEALNGKVYVMGGGWNMLRFAQLPQEWTFGVALGVDVPWDETNQRQTLTVHIEDPDGEMLGDQVAIDVEAGRPPGLIQGQDQRLPLTFGLRVTFAAAGPHAVVVRASGQEIGRARVYVVQIPGGWMASP